MVRLFVDKKFQFLLFFYIEQRLNQFNYCNRNDQEYQHVLNTFLFQMRYLNRLVHNDAHDTNRVNFLLGNHSSTATYHRKHNASASNLSNSNTTNSPTSIPRTNPATSDHLSAIRSILYTKSRSARNIR